MLDVWIDEQELAPGLKDPIRLTEWMLSSLSLIRRRSSKDEEDVTSTPIGKMMFEFALSRPNDGLDPREMLDTLNVSTTTLHHLLGRLRSARIVTQAGGSEQGHRFHRLRFGHLPTAVRAMAEEARMVLRHNLLILFGEWEREGGEVNQSSLEPHSLHIRIRDPSPTGDGPHGEVIVKDLGLSGERPGKDGQAEREILQILERMMVSDVPVTIEECMGLTTGSRARVTRQLVRLQRSGMVYRAPLWERLTQCVVDAINRQRRRRGDEWLVDKRRLGRLGEEEARNLLGQLDSSSENMDLIEGMITQGGPEEGRILLNVLGGQIPDGYSLAGRNAEEIADRALHMLDLFIARLGRAAERITLGLQKEAVKDDLERS